MCRQPENCGRHMECACYFVTRSVSEGVKHVVKQEELPR